MTAKPWLAIRRKFSRISRERFGTGDKLGFESLYVIPISALDGDNVVARSPRLALVEGPSLLEYLGEVEMDTKMERRPSAFPSAIRDPARFELPRLCRPTGVRNLAGWPPSHCTSFRSRLQADAAIVLIDTTKGVQAQSRRHTYIANLLRIEHLIVAVNKMDLERLGRRCASRSLAYPVRRGVLVGSGGDLGVTSASIIGQHCINSSNALLHST